MIRGYGGVPHASRPCSFAGFLCAARCSVCNVPLRLPASLLFASRLSCERSRSAAAARSAARFILVTLIKRSVYSAFGPSNEKARLVVALPFGPVSIGVPTNELCA